MSLSTQLARGALAAPMLVLFAALALAGGRAGQGAVSTVVRASSAAQACSSRYGVRTPALVQAQVPADLGTLALRWSRTCRA